MDKYRFYISFDEQEYTQVINVKPVNITGTLDSGSYRYSIKSGVWKIVRYENPTVYDTILPLFQSPSNLTARILVKIDLFEDFETLTATIYKGYIPISGVHVNENSGAIEFTPVQISDYDWYDKHKADKIDIYNEVNGSYHQLDYDVLTIKEVYYLTNDDTYITPAGFLEQYSSPETYNSAHTYVPGYLSNSWVVYNLEMYHCLTANGPDDVHNPTTGYWEKVIQEGGAPLNTVKIITRCISDLPFYTTEGGGLYGLLFRQGNGLYQRGFPMVLEEDDGSKTNLPTNRWSGAIDSAETGTMSLCGEVLDNSLPHDGYIVSDGGNHELMHILSHLLQIDYQEKQFRPGSGLTIVSEFLTAATNPVTGDINSLLNLSLVHNRVIKNIHDMSTKGEMTIEELLKDLCATLNMSWCIVGTNLYLEHINFFVNGFSYTGNNQTYADLTGYPLRYQAVNDLDGSPGDVEYKYTGTTPEKEIFHFPNGFDYDGQIRYYSKFAALGEELRHDISVFMTDFAYTLTLNSDTLDDCWCLIAANAEGKIIRRTAGLRWMQGPAEILGETVNNPFRPYPNLRNKAIDFPNPVNNYPNGDLMWNNILNDYFTFERIFKTGEINGNIDQQEFYTLRKIRTQRSIKFPRLDGVFDPYKLVNTNMGPGIVNTFDIDTNTDFIKVELMYHEES